MNSVEREMNRDICQPACLHQLCLQLTDGPLIKLVTEGTLKVEKFEKYDSLVRNREIAWQFRRNVSIFRIYRRVRIRRSRARAKHDWNTPRYYHRR